MGAGMTTPRPRIAAAVVIPMTSPEAPTKAPPAKPSCMGAVVRKTCSIDRRRPVGSGPPMMATMPALAVTTLLHERATATARWPTRRVRPSAAPE